MKSLLKKIVVTILTLEARLVLARYRPKIVAITGSVGKTSTKDAVYTVLSKHIYTRKSDKSFNSEIGLPLTILGLPNGWSNPLAWLINIIKGAYLGIFNFQFSIFKYPNWLVLEIGADRPGDIERLCQWLKPDVVIITRFGKVPVHVEFFKSQEDVIREKSFLVKALKENGLLILNNDDEDARALCDLRRDCSVATWSIERESDYQASNFEFTYATVNYETPAPRNPSRLSNSGQGARARLAEASGAAREGFLSAESEFCNSKYEEQNSIRTPTGITFKVNHSGNSVPITVTGCLGRQQVHPALAALAFGGNLGLNMVSMAESISGHETPPGRMKIIEGVKNTTVIDDTYNASPVAMSEALRTLKEIKIGGRKIAVLGDMLELGKYSENEHKKMGKEAKESCDILATVGLRARGIAEGAQNNGMDEKNIFQFDTSTEATKSVENLITEGDIVLVKGSQGARMEKIVEEIMTHPELKKKLLVRQEPEWASR